MDLASVDFYRALLARDRRFDGRFFVGVSSTKIYCRPICTVRTPRRENCSFYPSAAAAESSGFRPCLKCRPELAPGLSSIDASERYAAVALRLIDGGFLAEHSCTALAARLGISDRHLRRIFTDRFGASPAGVARSQRLLTAKRLLMDTSLPVGEVALIAGFGSLRRFNELFREHYRLTPSALRTRCAGRPDHDLALTFHLAWRPPYDWDAMLEFLRRRAIPGIEGIADGAYSRSLCASHGTGAKLGWIRVRAEINRAQVAVDVSASLATVIPDVLARVRQLFDLDAAPQEIAAVLGEVALGHPGLRLPGSVSGFEAALRVLLERRLGEQPAATLAARLAVTLGTPVSTPFPGITHAFPDAGTIAARSVDSLNALGIPGELADCMRTLAVQAAEGGLELDCVVDVEHGVDQLLAISGIDKRTANCIAMRAWSWPDAFMPDDPILRKRFPQHDPEQITALAERWRPWRSYAHLHLWQAVPAPGRKHEAS